MCKFELHCRKLGEFTENETGHTLNLMDEIPKYFLLKMNMEKSIFHFKKPNLEHIGNSVHTT